MVEDGLVQGPNRDKIVGLQNRVSRIESLSLGGTTSTDGEARVLAERGGAGDTEEVAVEVDRGGERGRELKERRESRKGNGATVTIGHDALDRTVVGDSRVAELHGHGGKLYPSGLIGGRGLRVGYVEVEESHTLSRIDEGLRLLLCDPNWGFSPFFEV